MELVGRPMGAQHIWRDPSSGPAGSAVGGSRGEVGASEVLTSEEKFPISGSTPVKKAHFLCLKSQTPLIVLVYLLGGVEPGSDASGTKLN